MILKFSNLGTWLADGGPVKRAAPSDALRENGTARSVEVAELNREMEF